jgi:hypothetical protein
MPGAPRARTATISLGWYLGTVRCIGLGYKARLGQPALNLDSFAEWSKLTIPFQRVEPSFPVVRQKSAPKQVFAVRCPTCGAAPGEKCELSTGQLRTSPHSDRRWIAAEKRDSLLENGGAQMGQDSAESNDKPSTTLPGTVEKIIKPIDPREPEKAQIDIATAEDLYREIRVENTLKDENDEEVALKEGAPVEVTIEADKKDTTKKAR